MQICSGTREPTKKAEVDETKKLNVQCKWICVILDIILYIMSRLSDLNRYLKLVIKVNARTYRCKCRKETESAQRKSAVDEIRKLRM